MVRNKRAFAAVLAAGAVGATALTGTAAHASSAEGNATQAAACVGTSFAGTLGPGKSICNGGYRVTMQTNGDLVLRVARTGRACYASGTRAPGDASAVFVGNKFGKPYVDINSTSQGRVGRILGAHTGLHFGTNASVNTKGEFWVGYRKVGWC